MLDTSTRAARPPANWVARLQRFIATPVERCELCGQMLPEAHDHLFDIDAFEAVCACLGCATALGAKTDGRYRGVPPKAERLDDFAMTDAEWRGLQVPIGMAFVVRSGADGGVAAYYPGPGGSTQSPIAAAAWDTILAANPGFDLAPDVEALLVDRVHGRRRYHRVSIDRCFVLVALFRQHWQGFTGGDAIWAAVDDFYAELDAPGPQRKGWHHG